MSAIAPPGQAPQQPSWPQIAEWCPLCGSPLHDAQDWCLRCGAAARTRLAATPRWRAPVLAFTTVIVVSLAVLIAALVKLIG